MNVMGLLDYLQEEVAEASKVPFTENCMVDREKLLNIIQDIRVTLPNEIKEAETIRAQRNEILDDAEREAHDIVDEAQQRAAQMVEENTITQQAYAEADRILQDAQNGAEQVRASADQYAMDLLEDLENNIRRSLEVVTNGMSSMQGR